MKIAIHHRERSFSDRWISYCRKTNIPFKLVDCFATDIIDQIQDCDALMWNWDHLDPRSTLFALQLIYSVEAMGKRVFPDSNTCWYFDDKIGQKYLFEAIGAPYVDSYIFYSREEALKWIDTITYPKVHKLRNGAGSYNVRLVNSRSKAKKIIKKSFRRGFQRFNSIVHFKESIRNFKCNKSSVVNLTKAFLRLCFKVKINKFCCREKGYVFFQDFIEGNDSDIRVVIIAKRAFAIKRIVRRNDFRASGSGKILYEKELIPIETIEQAFKISDKIKSQCIAFDFIKDNSGKFYIVEISHTFAVKGYDPCVGYWDKDLVFFEGNFNPQSWLVDMIVADADPE
ncbi:MAG: hypothetical protein ABFR75_13760 [Acidobacteriota bacterium]